MIKYIIIGLLSGIIFCLVAYYIFNEYLLSNHQNDILSKSDSTQINDLIDRVKENNFKPKSIYIDERINSIDKRFDDLYILGGIIIMLLLAINVGVYLKAESEVEKHFTENFDKYKKQIIQCVSDSESMIEKVITELNLLSKLRESKESVQKGIINDKTDDDPKSEA